MDSLDRGTVVEVVVPEASVWYYQNVEIPRFFFSKKKCNLQITEKNSCALNAINHRDWGRC